MASTKLLLSRLHALVKYNENWDKNDVVDLFISLTKQYENIPEPEFITRMSKTLYLMEIHKINKSDLILIPKTKPTQFVENIEDKVNNIAKHTREKTLEEILKEIQAQKKIDEKVLGDVKDIVSSVSSWCKLDPPAITNPTPSQWEVKETLFKLCKAVKKIKTWFPRATQMVSWCILALSGSSQLVQVGTGEGKSCIVAMFAAYCTVTGKSVDIISSSPVLAERDADEWRPFYKELKITVDVNTNKEQDSDLKKCYECKVVYGTTQSFAGDWLRQRFHRKDVRPGREFQCVIVDEVDSLMLDKGLEIVYLNSGMPVMQALNAVLAKIWCTVNQKTQDFSDDKTLREALEKRIKAEILSKTKMKPSKSQIPGFLEHINSKLRTWIENAILAKTMTLGHEYILHEDTVVPVDYQSTGVVQNNMKWGDGLQQFLEMKHQTRLTDMSVITNFKSNVSLFKSYKQHIYGVTGTLGNQTELDMLQELYSDIKICAIPSFKQRKLYEEDGMVIHNEEEWIQKICSVVEEKVSPIVYRGARAALVICETINRAETVHRALTERVTREKLKLYTNNNMDNSKVTGEEVMQGYVIIATNLAGRGTDLKICKEVNEAGGLFVVQTFLPLNVRVENQAFGRTARQGSPGSAQLIMCVTHFSESLKLVMAIQVSPLFLLLSCLNRVRSTLLITEFTEKEFADAFKVYKKNHNNQTCDALACALKNVLIMQEPVGPTILEEAKQARDTMVQMRLSGFLEKDIPKITKKEELFSDYLHMLDTIYQDVCTISREDMVSSLHECWGMWLLMKFKEEEPTETLRQQLKEDLHSAKKSLQSEQSPSSMVYHYIRSGNRLRHQGKLAESIEMYTRAVEDPCWVAIALYNRALSTLKRRDRNYIAQALADLEKAETEVESYIKELTLTINHVKISSNSPMESDSLFSKQFEVKKQVQELLKINIQEAVKTLRMANSRGGDVQVIKKHVLFLVIGHLLKSLRTMNEMITEVRNLSSLGLDTIISLDTRFSFFGYLKKQLHRVARFIGRFTFCNITQDTSSVH